jgi:hypothetical protein
MFLERFIEYESHWAVNATSYRHVREAAAQHYTRECADLTSCHSATPHHVM